MAIKYVVVAKKNPKTGAVAYYAQVAPVSPVTYDQVAEEIEKITSLSTGDISNVLKSLEYVIRQHLLAGESVRLGDLGSFRPTLTSKARDTATAVTADDIKDVHIQFNAGRWLDARTTKADAGVSFERYRNVAGGLETTDDGD